VTFIISQVVRYFIFRQHKMIRLNLKKHLFKLIVMGMEYFLNKN